MLRQLILSIWTVIASFSNPPAPGLIIPTPTVAQEVIALPAEYIIPIKSHIFQTFNNCGPASLSMLLSYYDRSITQQELGQKLRPYQNPRGDNDDKSVTLEELATEAQARGFTVYHRTNGNPLVLKSLIAKNYPVIIRTWLKPGEDIGHYRVIRGFSGDDFIQDDSLQGKNLRYNTEQLSAIWEPFNFEYLVLTEGESLDLPNQLTAWHDTKTRILSKSELGMYDYFNLSVAEYYLGNYSKSVDYFNKVEDQLPMRMLWYQIEPIQSFFRIGEYDRVMEITNRILNNHNRAFSELYDLRGQVYLKQNNHVAAENEFAKARLYNENYVL